MTNEKQTTAYEETRIAAYLSPILYPANECRVLPEAFGKYCIRYTREGLEFSTESAGDEALYQGFDFTPKGAKTSVKVCRAARLTLSKGTLPAAYKELSILKGLPLIQATLETSADDILVDADKLLLLASPATEVFLTPQAALSRALYKAYGVNLGSLWGLLEGACFEGLLNYAGWIAMQGRLAQRAFGHEEPPEPYRTLPSIQNREGFEFKAPITRYYYLADVYYLVALLDLVEAKEIPLSLPASDCVIRFNDSGEDRAEVIFFDKGALEGSEPVPLQGRPEYGRAANKTLAEIFRFRHEIREAREQRRKALDALYGVENRWRHGHLSLAARAAKEQELPAEERANREALRIAVGQLYEKESARQDDLLGLYSELTRWAVQQKEPILKAQREKQRIAGEVGEARTALSSRAESFVQLPNNMDMLPAHFAAIPKGLASGLELVNDHFGRAILRVGRTPLDVPGQKARPHTPLTLPLVGLNDAEKSATFEQAKLILGDNGPRWLLPQGLVAVSKLYRAGGGYSKESFVHRLYLNDWIDTMRPAQVERFKAKGRASAFGYERSPKDLYHALLGVLNRLTYERDNGPEWSQLSGFYLIVEHGEDSRGIWTDIMLNPNLHRFVIGAEGLPYMMTNTDAMLSYNKAALDYTPAAQWGLEQLARENLYGRDTATLSDPKGGGFTRLALAHRFGLIKGPEDSPGHLLRRFEGVLDNLGKAGVIADAKIDGREKAGADAFGVKLLVTMHDDYRKAYNLTKKENALARLDKQLEAPFAPPKKLPRTPPAPGQPRKRGRPPKKG